MTGSIANNAAVTISDRANVQYPSLYASSSSRRQQRASGNLEVGAAIRIESDEVDTLHRVQPHTELYNIANTTLNATNSFSDYDDDLHDIVSSYSEDRNEFSEEVNDETVNPGLAPTDAEDPEDAQDRSDTTSRNDNPRDEEVEELFREEVERFRQFEIARLADLLRLRGAIEIVGGAIWTGRGLI
ncbi:hypothetical protein EKO04_003553 [Ascochyta lentis]|uniref:Uncharacterized protein n=1 Tax=Ascochyta lentis TaxID=205686 RepID=A0A8H7J8F6_9PLEO|nr:hypothetical protein EKO04_003553 [Ascochyta lentis]